MFFQLKVVTHERLKDTEGNLIQTVVALSLSDEGLRDMSARTRADEDQVLLSIDENPQLSSRDRAQQLGWRIRSGDPNHTRVLRAERELVKAKLITKNRDAWELTDRGKKEVAQIKTRAPAGTHVPVPMTKLEQPTKAAGTADETRKSGEGGTWNSH
jgi:hypothetical protein